MIAWPGGTPVRQLARKKEKEAFKEAKRNAKEEKKKKKIVEEAQHRHSLEKERRSEKPRWGKLRFSREGRP